MNLINSRKKEIQIKAEIFREKCKKNSYSIIDLFKECGSNGYYLIRYPLGADADLGFSVKKDKDFVIFTNTSSRLSREIFTLAHEIGHIQLHFEKNHSFVETPSTISGCVYDEKEQEANYFATCLLMPKDQINKFFELEISNTERLSAMDIARLMSEFNVSFEMVLNRLENIGIISSSERIRIDSEKNKMRVGNLLKSVGGNGRLNEASEEINIPIQYLNYVIYNYNHNAIPQETLEKVLEYYCLSIEDVGDKLLDRHSEYTSDLDDLIGGMED